ncbi:hypothetical protein THIOM_003020 [Candidatus Thiomargarita nelsonii]|uniref:Uncharacterized protein n=1 Tax=Candidatus Thiomargarita nelsonii TaxID=1003181 RepID=A0A0A6RIQ8_9GAMM|nr:hypothetical protein THIOM_003020 [Candidatus Thiomargarita nelsonii]
MKNVLKVILLCFLVEACSGNSECVYTPVVFDYRQGHVERPLMVSKEHLDNVEIVLKHYDFDYFRQSDMLIKMKGDICGDKDLIMNITSKANNKLNWLNIQGYK